MSRSPFEPNDDAATALNPDERDQLIPSYITTRAQLNEAEQLNIADADHWAFTRKRDVLDVAFLRRLHKRMFGQVWRWAGEYRTTASNIGIDAYQIPSELSQLVEDARFWLANDAYEFDEAALRFHHRLVFIHPFPNGNGRHARMAADLLAAANDHPRFSWGATNLTHLADARERYVAALRAADNHDMRPLIAFARS